MRRLKFAIPQEAIVHEDTSLAFADRLMHERRGDGGVNASGQPAHNPASLSNLFANTRDLFFDNCFRRPITAAFTN